MNSLFTVIPIPNFDQTTSNRYYYYYYYYRRILSGSVELKLISES